MIPYGKQDITDADIDAVVQTLKSDFLTQGPQVPKFENHISERVGSKFTVAFNSATSALHAACMALNLKKGDIVWTSPITFVASANCALYCGASVDFVDIDLTTFNICLSKLKEKLEIAREENKLPKIVICVHLAGLSCAMKEIYLLSKEYGFHIIEDASHAIGATYLAEPVGSCRYSDICVFSYHPVKLITTAEGGSASTNNPELAKKLRLFRSHGVTKDSDEFELASPGDWYYEQQLLGYNYRMTEIQAALGVSQLARLSNFVQHRSDLVDRYRNLLLDYYPDIVFSDLPENYTSSHHLCIIRLSKDRGAYFRNSLFKYLRDNGILVNIHYIPVHTQPFYKRFGFAKSDFPNAMEYYESAISIPVFHTMSLAQQDFIVDKITTFMKAS